MMENLTDQTKFVFDLSNPDFASQLEVSEQGEIVTEHAKNVTAHTLEVEILDAPNQEIENRLQEIDERLFELDSSIDNLTSHADKLDYAMAVASGALTGILDAIFVKTIDLDSITNPQSGDDVVDKLLKTLAERDGYTGKNPVAHFEEKFEVKQDNIWKGRGINVSASSHHLDDLAHHPTIAGLVAAIAVEFLNVGIFANKKGETHFLKVGKKPAEMVATWTPVIISGVLMWIAYVAENYVEKEFDKEIPKPIKSLITAVAASPAIIQILKISSNWAGHLISDINGSKSSVGAGMGIPGFFVSFLKEVSMIPPINKSPLPIIVKEMYVDNRFDLRDELTVAMPVINAVKVIGKQAIPVAINEIIVRSFYFVRHLVAEVKENSGLENIDWHKTIPFGNRTIERMITIATGTFCVVDSLDAVIEGAIHSHANGVEFGRQVLLRLNFVGIGRFTIALGTETVMGIKKFKATRERRLLKNEILYHMQVKMYHGEVLVWEATKDASASIDSLYEALETILPKVSADLIATQESLQVIEQIDIHAIEGHNPDLMDDLRKAWRKEG